MLTFCLGGKHSSNPHSQRPCMIRNIVKQYVLNNCPHILQCGHYYSPKTITKPETVLKRWVHYVQTHIEGKTQYHPEENEGFLRHFKIRDWWGEYFANDADKQVNYTIRDPKLEIGLPTLDVVTRQIRRMVRHCKKFSKSRLI